MFTQPPSYPLDARLMQFVYSIPMKIDHFNELDNKTFNMRFAMNAEFFNQTGPMILCVGGESNIENQLGIINTGIVHEIAENLGAVVFVTEHRYYGESIPNSNLKTVNMQFLTIEQALADLADFIKKIKKDNKSIGKVILVGGSYAGTLAATMRQKYPKLVDISFSSSGIFHLKPNNYEYIEIVKKAFSGDSKCEDIITNSFKEIKYEMLQTKDGLSLIKDYFKLCEPLDSKNPMELAYFFDTLVVYINNVVQYNNQGAFLSTADLCKVLKNKTEPSNYPNAKRLSNLIVLMKNLYENDDCSLSYDRTLQYLKGPQISSSKSWLYQSCTEIGSFVTTDSENSIFLHTIPLSFWYKFCYDLFDNSFSVANLQRKTLKFSNQYRANEQKVNHIVYTIGTLDPWSGEGLKESPNKDSPLIKIKGGSHSSDLAPYDDDNDSKEVLEARQQIKSLIYKWARKN